MHLAEDLLSTIKSSSQQDWLVLAGDGRTYQHLFHAKQHYGSLLEKVILLLVIGSF